MRLELGGRDERMLLRVERSRRMWAKDVIWERLEWRLSPTFAEVSFMWMVGLWYTNERFIAGWSGSYRSSCGSGRLVWWRLVCHDDCRRGQQWFLLACASPSHCIFFIQSWALINSLIINPVFLLSTPGNFTPFNHSDHLLCSETHTYLPHLSNSRQILQ